MARPAWTSKDDPPVTVLQVAGTVTANQGNWTQGQSGQPLANPRFIYIWDVDDQRIFGAVPPTRSKPDVHFPGEGLRTIKLTPGYHAVRLRIYAGNLYDYPADPDSPMYEWGTGHVATDEPYVVAFDVRFPEPAPEPDLAGARAELNAAIAEWEASLPIRWGWKHPVAGLRHARAARGFLH
jgi:hypothetical protein